MYSLGFIINDKPVKPVRDYPNSTEAMNRMHRKNGWKPFGWFYLDERRSEHSQCNIKHSDLKNIHDAIFGPGAFDNEIKAQAAKIGQTATIGKRVTLQDVAKLVLGAVGIQFDIAIAEDGVDGYRSGEVTMDIDSEKPGISAAHLRKICKIPLLENDGKFLFQQKSDYRHFCLETRPIFPKFRSRSLSILIAKMRMKGTIGDRSSCYLIFQVTERIYCFPQIFHQCVQNLRFALHLAIRKLRYILDRILELTREGSCQALPWRCIIL